MQTQHVIISREITPLINDTLKDRKYSKVGVLVDSNTHEFCYPKLSKNLPAHSLLKVEAGEKFKTIETCANIWEQLTQFEFDRHSLLIVLGGGVLGDMGGFCASTFKRGIDFILIPTTLLSQVDASVGGKLGIDFKGYKNHIGLFKEPTATLISSTFLETLPPREIKSGFAEVIKHCLISDAEKWKSITGKNLEAQNWDDLIEFSFQFKSGVTNTDPYEAGLRKILNFGHTVGHAVESCSLASKSPFFHGEAIAIGMIAESHISAQKGLISQDILKEITNYILSVFGKEQLPETDKILGLMGQDKKNKGKAILMALIESIGQPVWDVEVNENEIRNSLDYYRSLQM